MMKRTILNMDMPLIAFIYIICCTFAYMHGITVFCIVTACSVASLVLYGNLAYKYRKYRNDSINKNTKAKLDNENIPE